MRLADVYSQQRRRTDLASTQKRLAEAWEASMGPDAVVVANTLHRLARTQLQNGDFAGGKESINRAIEILERKYGDVAATAHALATLALMRKAWECRRRESGRGSGNGNNPKTKHDGSRPG